jgi:hypothetical protein
VSQTLSFIAACRAHRPRVTEFKSKDQLGSATSTLGPKKKGPQNRRTKRGGLSAVSTDLDNAASTTFPDNAEDLKSAPRKQWPCLVQSQIYNPDYPTFCECLQPHCHRHCPVARDLLFRRCTDYSWPDPGIMGFSDRLMPPELRANGDTGVQTGHSGNFNKDPGGCKSTPSINVSVLNEGCSF